MSRRLVIGCVVLAACGGDASVAPVNDRAASSITLAPVAPTLRVGATTPMVATVRDRVGNVLRVPVRWTTSSPSIASVSGEGMVTAFSPGHTWLHARAGTVSDSTAITVEPDTDDTRRVARVVLDDTSSDWTEGEQRQLMASPRNAAGQILDGLAVTWRSTDTLVAQVDVLGRVTALRVGQARIVASVHGVEASTALRVTADYAHDLLISVPRMGAESALLRFDLQRMDLRAVHSTPAVLLSDLYVMQAVASPDGFRVAYVCMNPMMGDAALCMADRDGGNRRLIAYQFGNQLLAPTWSPDGLYLAFEHRGHHGRATPTTRIGIVRADGQEFRTLGLDLPGAQYAPAWSPTLSDGTTRLVFAHDADGLGASMSLWTMTPTGNDLRRLTTGAEGVDTEPTWSPDGRHVAFQRSASAAYGSLWTVDVATGAERLLYRALPTVQRSPSWSPDGKLIAFLSATPVAGLAPAWAVQTIWADGTRIAQRTNGQPIAFAPAWQRMRP